MILEESDCPLGVCVTCASAALAAQEFRMFVKNSENLWMKAITNLSNIGSDWALTHNDFNDSCNGSDVKAICAYVTKDDLTVETTADYTTGKTKTFLVRTKSRKTKKRTQRRGPTVKCPDCGKSFTSPCLLHAHLKNTHKDACVVCGTITLRGSEMKQHMFIAHGLKSLLCTKCPALFTNKTEFETHQKMAHRPGSYTCSQCGRTLSTLPSFDYHMLQMHAVYTCRACGAQFSARTCYRVHRSRCEPDAKPDTKNMSRIQRSNVRDPANYICDYCNKCYTIRSQLKNHIQWIHLDIRPFQCQWCGKRFHSIGALNEHDVVHTRERKFECDICGVKLVSKMAAVYHRRRHTGEKPYKCEDCDACFISSSRRLEHAKRKHNKGVKLQCPECPSRFVRKMELAKHAAKVHAWKPAAEPVNAVASAVP